MLKLIKKNYLLLLVFFAALFLRLWGTRPGFPPYQPDENMSYSTAIHMFYHHFQPNRFDYPAGVPLLHNLLYQTLLLPVFFFKLFIPHPRVYLAALKLGNQFLEEFKVEIFGQSNLKAMFWSRYIAASVGALTIPLVYLTGKKLFSKRVGLLAAFFLTFNYRHVLGSHFGLPDIHNSFFSLLALFASVLLLEKNTKTRYLFAGATCGLALSIKYQPFSFLPFLLVHFAWALRKKSFRYLFRADFIKACFLAFLVFLTINPYYFFNLHEVKKMNRLVYLRYGMDSFKLRLYPYFYLYHWGLGRLPSLVIVFGILFMLLTAPKKFLLIFSFVFSFFFVLTYYSDGGSYPRNFVSVIPILMIFAGFFMDLLYQSFKRRRFLPVSLLTIFLLFYLNLSSIKNSLTLSYYYAQPWNITKLDQWLREKLPINSQLRIYPIQIDQQVLRDLKGKEVKMLDWSYSQGPHSKAEFQEEGTDFAILDAHSFEGITYWWRQWPNDIFFKYNQVPFDYINSSFFGLTVQELLNYTVGEIYKPWQAASEYNYLIFKIPPKPKNIGKKIVFFSFDNSSEFWTIRSTFGFSPLKGGWESEEGKEKQGSLLIKGGGGEATSRLSSPPIKVKPGKLYTIRGWIKNSPPREEKPDSFLRIDFYQGKSEEELDKIGLNIGLSPRTPVSDEWVQAEANLVAPSKANYLTVSFQRQAPSLGFNSYLDDVEIFESEVLPAEKFPEVPFIESIIPFESLYPNSFL